MSNDNGTNGTHAALKEIKDPPLEHDRTGRRIRVGAIVDTEASEIGRVIAVAGEGLLIKPVSVEGELGDHPVKIATHHQVTIIADPAEVAPTTPVAPAAGRTVQPSTDKHGKPIYVGCRVRDDVNGEGGVVIAAADDSLMVDADMTVDNARSIECMVASDVAVVDTPPIPADRLPDPRPVPPLTPQSDAERVAAYTDAMLRAYMRAFKLFDELVEALPEGPANETSQYMAATARRKLEDLQEWMVDGETAFLNTHATAMQTAVDQEAAV